MIPKTFEDDEQQDRRYIFDYWDWLKNQPQDAWLLWARCANWDNADTIFDLMVDRPDCDLALVSWIFWGCSPAYYVRNPARYGNRELIGKIVSNCQRSFYTSSDLFYDRYEVAINAHEYLKALREKPAAGPPFELPRLLCGPFDGRRASIARRYDDRTERDLAVIFQNIDGSLPRSEAEHWESEERGGNLWIKDRLALPTVAMNPMTTYAHLAAAAYVEAIFGKAAAYAAARAPQKAPRKKWWPFG